MSKHDEHDESELKEMDRREFLKRTAVGAGAVALTMAMPGLVVKNAMAEAVDLSRLPMKYKDYNIVMLSFDAVQAAHIHSLGYPRNITPTIDAMAKEGFNFTNAISTSSWTVPAAMSWFTGVSASEHKLFNKFSVYNPPNNKLSKMRELAPHLVTLAEVLKQNGYATGGFTGNAGMSGVFGYSLGFDTYFDKIKFGGMDKSIPLALDWLKDKKDKKFFLFLHGYDAHGQHVPEGGFDYRFVDKGYDRKFTGSKEEQEALREEGLEKGVVNVRDEDVRFWRAIYDEKIQRTDADFAGFLKAFEKMGLMDKTIFILTSDHGTEMFEHNKTDHGFSLYDELVHVPLVLKLPNRKDGKVITDQISSLNVMPTILDLLDVKVPANVAKQMRGKSLSPALQGKSMSEDVFCETDYRHYTFKRSIQTKDGWKFIYTLENKSRELYNLKNDPKETKNLVETEPKKAYELEQRLFAHFKDLGVDLAKTQWKTGMNPVYESQGKGAP